MRLPPVVVGRSSVPGHSGPGAPQEQEAGVALPLQEEVGLCGGAGAHRGGEVGGGGGSGGGGAAAAAAAHSACLQAQEVLPLAPPAVALASPFIMDGNHASKMRFISFYFEAVGAFKLLCFAHVRNDVALLLQSVFNQGGCRVGHVVQVLFEGSNSLRCRSHPVDSFLHPKFEFLERLSRRLVT